MKSKELKTDTKIQVLQLKNWLNEISLLDGKCCYVSKKSELRAKLLLIIDLNEEYGGKIKHLFDEKLWIRDGNIYELNSIGLKELQDTISEAGYIDKLVRKHSFNLKEEFFKFTLNQSTLIALFLACVLLSRFIIEKYKAVIFLDVLIYLLLMISICVVMAIIDSTTKKISFIAIIFFIVTFTAIMISEYPYNSEAIFIGYYELAQLAVLIVFNTVLVTSSLFSLFYSSHHLVYSYKKVPGVIFFIVGIFFYAILTIVFLQGVKTISFS